MDLRVQIEGVSGVSNNHVSTKSFPFISTEKWLNRGLIKEQIIHRVQGKMVQIKSNGFARVRTCGAMHNTDPALFNVLLVQYF